MVSYKSPVKSVGLSQNQNGSLVPPSILILKVLHCCVQLPSSMNLLPISIHVTEIYILPLGDVSEDN